MIYPPARKSFNLFYNGAAFLLCEVGLFVIWASCFGVAICYSEWIGHAVVGYCERRFDFVMDPTVRHGLDYLLMAVIVAYAIGTAVKHIRIVYHYAKSSEEPDEKSGSTESGPAPGGASA